LQEGMLEAISIQALAQVDTPCSPCFWMLWC